LPIAADLVAPFFAIDHVTEGKGQAGAFRRVDRVMDRLDQELFVGQAGAFGAARPWAIEGELDSVKEGGFAAATDAAEQDNGPGGAVALHRRQLESLPGIMARPSQSRGLLRGQSSDFS